MSDLPPLPVAPAAGGAQADRYGLGTWGGVLVDLGPLFAGFTIPNLHGRTADGTPVPNADDAYQAFLAAPPQVQAQIQHELDLAGYYPASAFVQPGAIGPDDEAAFKKFLVTVLQTQDSARNQNAPVISASDQLAQRAAYGQQQGAVTQLQNQQQGSAAPQNTTVNLTDAAAVGLAYEQAAEQELGFKPDRREINAFVAGFQARQRAAQTPPTPSQPGGQPDLAGIIANGTAIGSDSPTAPLGIPAAAPLGASPLLAAHEQLGQASGQVADLDSIMGRIGLVTPAGNWSANAQAAGLGGNAPLTPANSQFVLRYLLSRAVQTTGDWASAITKVTGDPELARQTVTGVDPNDRSLAAPAGDLTLGAPPAAEPTTTTVTAPDLSADATAAARAAHPGAYGANQTAQAFDNFLTAIGVRQ